MQNAILFEIITKTPTCGKATLASISIAQTPLAILTPGGVLRSTVIGMSVCLSISPLA